MKIQKIFAVLLIIVCLGSIISIAVINRNMNTNYMKAIECIRTEDYDTALRLLQKINRGKLSPEEMYDDIKYGYSVAFENYYKNSGIVAAFALAKMNEDRSGNEEYVHNFLEYKGTDYRGDLCGEIVLYEKEFEPEYKEYLKRKAQKEKEAEERRIREENERIRNSVPYVGMSESRINDTILGTNYEIVHNSVYEYGKKQLTNIYRFKKGNGIIFVARCLHGKVIDAVDFRDDPWVLNSYSSSSKTNDDDPYDVNDYNDPEDFYYDNYDDFWDYEEAEDYYNSYHEDP